ncbi:MAG: ribosome biogenesis GTPase A [Polyangiales bacterium]
MAFFDSLFDQINNLARPGKSVFDRVERFIDDVLLLPEEAKEALTQGETLLREERYEEAEKRFLQVLAERPSLTKAALGLAHAREGLGDLTGTYEALMEAREYAPEDAHLALWTARAALAAGHAAEARDAALAASRGLAREGGDNFADACATLAWAEWHEGRPDRAVRELRKALSVSDRDDFRVALVAALVDAGDAAGARSSAAGLDPLRLGPTDAWRVGESLVKAGHDQLGQRFMAVAADAGVREAWVALGRVTLSLGDPLAAESQARRAIAEGGGAPALTLLADALLANGDDAGAAEAHEGAAQSTSGTEAALAWARALRVVPRTEVTALKRYSDGLSAYTPDNTAAAQLLWAARLILLTDGVEALPNADAIKEPRLALAAASKSAEAKQHREALHFLDVFDSLQAGCCDCTAADRADADELRRSSLRAVWRGAGEIDLAAAIDAAAKFGEERGLGDVARGALRLRDELDRPLLVGVLGEFNAGKSTFINAFIGANVAPMGIVPTTATLNVLRGGANRVVRVVFRDGSTREGSHEALRPILEELNAVGADADGAKGVDQVEIVVPSELLERVWILDSPGTNALDPEHERLAREAARRADVVLWVFDAAQAGKMTETKMHTEMRAQGRLVLPILNKCDRLKEGELEEVSAVIEQGFGVKPVPLSAKRALKAKLEDDAELLEESGFPDLMRRLDADVFSQARALKRQACAGRLATLLDDAFRTEQLRADARAIEAVVLEKIREELPKMRRAGLLAVDDALRVFARELDEAFTSAREEVLAFARPRRGRFASKGVHPEDRAFLREVLGRRVREAIERCEKRLRAQLRAAFAVDWPEGQDPRAGIDEALRPALTGFAGYQRGRLDGGLERFFDEELARNELSAEGVSAALAKVRADERDELRPGLLEAVEGIIRDTDEGLDTAVQDSRGADASLRSAVLGPLMALRDVLMETRDAL